MPFIASIAAIVFAFVSPADGKAARGWQAASSHWQVGGYKLPRLPQLQRLPRLPRP